MSARHAVLLASAIVLAAAPVSAQVLVGGGIVYGAPIIVVPVPIVGPFPGDWQAYPNLRAPGAGPSCLRAGRCTLADLEVYYRRPEMLERRAPGASGPAGGAPFETQIFAPGMKPTPDEELRPEFRGAGQPRAEFETSGQPLTAPR